MRRGDVIGGRFEVEGRVAAGAMGSIHRALDRATGAKVALKALHGGERDPRFVREARVLAELDHPGVVRYVSHGALPSGDLYLAMEWLEGEDLSRRLRREPVSQADAVALAARVADALGAAHALGIVHRDVKPGNIFLPDGDMRRAKVIDFGIARLTAGTQIATHTGVLLGTPGYMAPEQARGIAGVDARADVFALGCVLYRCLAGCAPFAGEDVLAVLAKLVLEDPAPLSSAELAVPRALSDLVARMMAKNPEDRPADGAAVARALAGITLDRTDAGPASEAAPRSITGAERRLVSVVMVSAVPSVLGPPPDEVTTRSLAEEAPPSLEAFDAQLVGLADGSIVATLQIQGEPTDQAARAARYALALRAGLPSRAMVLATGHRVLGDRVPFGEVVDRAAALLHRTRATTPARVDPRIRLDEVTAGLLSHRFEIGGDETSLFLEREREPFGGASGTLLGEETPLVGRNRELAALESIFDECVTGSEACAVVLTAPTGVGKSRLGGELLLRIAERIGTSGIWIAPGDPVGAGSPLQMLGQAIRRCAGIQRGEPLGVCRQKLRARVGRSVGGSDLRRITELLGELAGVPFPDDDRVELASARRDPVQMGDAMRRAFEDFLAAECGLGPVVIVLEDLHWGDLASTRWLDAALRNLDRLPLFVLALGRPEIADLFPGLWSERRKHEIRLMELSRRTSEDLVRRALGAGVDPSVVAQIVELGRGNAFYLEELVRAVAEGHGGELPETVLAMVEARLSALPEGARRVLRAASTYGQLFWRAGVADLLGVTPTEIDRWLDDLARREVILRRMAGRFAGEEEYVFRHALVREAAYAMLTEEDRRLGHRLAAAWLTRAGERDAAILAEHFERGGDPTSAASQYLRAAGQAMEGNDYAAAIARAERGVASGAEGEDLGALRLVQAEASHYSGQYQAMKGFAEQATALLERGSARWCAAMAELVYASSTLGEHDRIPELADELLSIEARGASLSWMIAAARVALHLIVTGRLEAGERVVEHLEARPIPRAPDAAVLGHIAKARSAVNLFRGDVGAFLTSATAAAENLERAGAIRSMIGERANMALAYVLLGAFAEAERVFRDVRAAADRMGLALISIASEQGLSRVLAQRGAMEEARPMIDRAVAAAVAQRSRRLEGFCRIDRAKILLLAGDAEGAEEEAGVAESIPSLSLDHRAHALAVVGRALLAQARVYDAELVTARAVELSRSADGIEEGEALIHLARVEALIAGGHQRDARDALAEAHDRLLERAAKISDPAWRESFLSRVPEHARLIELGRVWLDAGQA